ncbi:hypothetical protein [Stenomitos frigidus]|nr:hypothetical protein [Stenomitos frigidus]
MADAKRLPLVQHAKVTNSTVLPEQNLALWRSREPSRQTRECLSV